MGDKAAQKALVEKIQAHFGDKITEVDLDVIDPFIRVEADDWSEIALYLRDDCGLNYLACLTAIDRGRFIVRRRERGHEARGEQVGSARLDDDSPALDEQSRVTNVGRDHRAAACERLGDHVGKPFGEA